MASSNDSKTWDKAKDLLTILVIPLLLWGVRLEVRTSQIDTIVVTQAKLTEDLHDLEVQVASMSRPVQENTSQVAEIKVKLELVSEQVEETNRMIKMLRTEQ